VSDSLTREQVLQRAGRCCEYCLLHEDDDPLFTFHIEHIIAKQHGGTDALSNLALACVPPMTSSSRGTPMHRAAVDSCNSCP
jgi:5-methylcytosine-specific restriction endonuclease McrA